MELVSFNYLFLQQTAREPIEQISPFGEQCADFHVRFHQKLARLGVEDALLKLGAKAGCAVTIGDMTFDWEPQTPAGVDITPTGRGTDARLERNDRVGAAERKEARRLRREHGDDE